MAKKLDEGLIYLESMVGEGGYAAGDKFTTADCEVTPVLFMVNAVLSGLGRLEVMAVHAKLNAYTETAKKDPVLDKVMGEMTEGLKAFRR